MLSLFLQLFLIFGFAAEPTPPQESPVRGRPMPWVAHLLRQQEGQKISELSFPQERFPVLLVPQKNDLRPLVELRLQFEKPGWELYNQNGKKVKKLKNSNLFVVFAFLNSQVNELVLVAKNTEGESRSEKIYLFAPEVQEFEIVSPWSSIYANVGLSYMTYEQSRFGVLVWKGANVGIGYDTLENSNPIDYHLFARMTVLSFQTQPIAANPQYINAHAHVSYRLPWSENTRWRYYATLGGGYFNLNSFGSDFGFSGLFAPQLAFRAKHFVTTKSSFLYDIKLTPFQNFDLGNSRGFELNWTWSKVLKSSRRQDVSIKYDNTRFQTGGLQVGIEFISLNIGYSL